MALQKNVFEYLERSAERFAEKTAFADEKGAYTFGALLRAAESIGSFLCDRTAAHNRPVAVLVERSASSIAAFQGVLASGNYYVPLDRDMPEKRLSAILRQLQPACILAAQDALALLDRIDCPCESFSIEQAQRFPAAPEQLAERRRQVLDIDPVYVIFTSGSTGMPKGIVISHRAVIDFTEWMSDQFGFTSEDVLANQAPFYFDLSVKDIYQTLRCGCTTHILPKKLFLFPKLLLEYAQRCGATAFIWATSAFHLVANSGALARVQPPALRKVILGGEALRAKELNIWRRALPDVQYVNLYGPTEVTVDCTCYVIDREFQDHEPVPIGRACANKQVLLLDEALRPVPCGEVGEICVRGVGLARGYYADPEKTARAFVQNPLNPAYPDLIYRTGDLGVMDQTGLIRFVSRKDSQIKHMSYRIELGEIETALNALHCLRAAVCLFDRAKDRILCVYEGEADKQQIVAELRQSLPKYMFPNLFYRVDQMPYNANGKIDRVALQERYLCETTDE